MFVYQRVPLGCAQVQRGTRQTCSIFVGEDVKTQASPRDWTGQCQLQFMPHGLFCALFWIDLGNMGLFKVFFYFPNGKSTIWGIYSEYFFYFLEPLTQIQGKIAKILYLDQAIANNECDIWPANMWVSEMVVMYPTILGGSTCNHRVGMGRNLLYHFFGKKIHLPATLIFSRGIGFWPIPR